MERKTNRTAWGVRVAVGATLAVAAGCSSDKSSSSGPSEVSAIEAALSAPESAFGSADESAAFGDEKVSKLASRISAARPLGETPDDRGWVSDSVDELPEVAELTGRHDRDTYLVHVAVAGQTDEPVTVEGTLSTSSGAVLARRIFEAEADDRFVARSRPLVAGVKSRSFHLSVSSTDTDRLLALVVADAVPTVKLTFGDAEIPVELSASAGSTFRIEGGPMVTVSVTKNPRGPCRVTDAATETEVLEGSHGPVSIVRGALRRDGKHVGFLRGFFGKAADDRYALVFKTIDLAGKSLGVGILRGELGYAPKVGGLRDGARGIGSFHARGIVESDGPTKTKIELGITLFTECRAE